MQPKMKYRIRPIYRTVRLVFSKLQEKSDMKNLSKKRTPGTEKCTAEMMLIQMLGGIMLYSLTGLFLHRENMEG